MYVISRTCEIRLIFVPGFYTIVYDILMELFPRTDADVHTFNDYNRCNCLEYHFMCWSMVITLHLLCCMSANNPFS